MITKECKEASYTKWSILVNKQGNWTALQKPMYHQKNLYIFIWPDFFINQALFIVNKSIMQYTIYKIIGTSINNIWQKLPYVLVLQLWFHKENKLKRRLFWYITISSSFKIIINLRFDK